MLSSLELRWFGAGPLPAAIRAWLDGLGAEPPATLEPERADLYLVSDQDALGVKFRGGDACGLEIKARHREHGAYSVDDQMVGRLEEWRKWTLTDAHLGGEDLQGIDRSWVRVVKERELRRYVLAEDGGVLPAPAEGTSAPTGSRACSLECARVHLDAPDNRTWWTLCFEASGKEAGLRETLDRVTRYVLAHGAARPPSLTPADSCGYPAWLRGVRSIS